MPPKPAKAPAKTLPMKATSKHLRITGRVQGVGYRAWFERQARLLGLGGWVRNRTDGSVEAVIHGAPEQINRMIKDAETGPSFADVKNIEETDTAYNGQMRFEVHPTA